MISYKNLLEELKNSLKRRNLKYTRQREVILKVLYKNREHHTPEEILDIIKQEFPKENIGIATVYRTLSLYEDEGLVDSISFGKDGKRYEIGHKNHHDHLICSVCGKIVEFIDDIIEIQQEKVAKEYNFKMQSHVMKIVGICEDCQKKNRS